MCNLKLLLATLSIVHLSTALEFQVRCSNFSIPSGELRKVCEFFNVTVTSETEAVTGISDKSVSTESVYMLSSRGANKMTFIPTGMGSTFSGLHNISLSMCSITSIKRENFANMDQLIYLQITGNEIESIAENSFVDLLNLEFLSLCGNHIKTLPENLIAKQVKLDYFRADANQFEVLPAKFFDNCPEISKVFMRSGRLTSIKVDFTKLSKLTMVDFTLNPCTNQTFDVYKNTQIGEFQTAITKTCA